MRRIGRLKKLPVSCELLILQCKRGKLAPGRVRLVLRAGEVVGHFPTLAEALESGAWSPSSEEQVAEVRARRRDVPRPVGL